MQNYGGAGRFSLYLGGWLFAARNYKAHLCDNYAQNTPLM